MNQQPGGQAEGGSRLERLLPLVESDPANLALLADAAETALAEGRPDAASDLLARYEEQAPLPAEAVNLAGIAAMQQGRFDRAAAAFDRLLEEGADDPAIRFNLAWARANLGDRSGALDLLDETAARALPQAAALKVQLLHDAAEFEAAAEHARGYVEWHPDHRGLLAAVSVLALDIDDEALAARCAKGAGDHPDALATLGTLALGEDRATEALGLFEQALERNQKVPRAWVGRGLARLMTGDNEGGAADIDQGAEMFGDHLGSWIAAGWARFVGNDPAGARVRFEKALEIDPTFAETHGSLAVLDLLEGNEQAARERSEVAFRLDRNCFSAALARSLLAAGEGDADKSRAIYERAVNTPVDASGRTIAQALARMGMGGA